MADIITCLYTRRLLVLRCLPGLWWPHLAIITTTTIIRRLGRWEEVRLIITILCITIIITKTITPEWL